MEMEKSKPYEVVVIGGSAVQTKAYPTLCQIGKWFLDQRYQTFFIDGAESDGRDITAITPQTQVEKVYQSIPDIRDPKKKILYVTHCLGMAAAINLMAEDPGNSRLVALSPCLPTPLSTVMQPHFQKNIAFSTDNKRLVPAYSWSDEPFRPTQNPYRLDANLPEDYFEKLNALEPGFSQAVNSLEQRGRIKLVVPHHDWNEPGIAAARDFSNIMHVNATHSLLDREFSEAPDALYRRIINFALD